MYKINEIFYSIQGEGARAGTANVFVRFSGCDLTCAFCDTEFESGTNMDARVIAARVAALMPSPRAVILTGGEPCLQYDAELYEELRAIFVDTIAIETNGGTKPKAPVDWVSCSPKVAEHVVAANFPNGVSELRYVRHPGQSIPAPAAKAQYLYLSPEFKGNVLQKESLRHCIELVKANPQWGLSLQQQKLWEVR
jgi:organic radical activating enzyme